MAETLAQVQSSLALWYAARDEIAHGQSVSINGRSWTAANLPEIRATIADLERKEKRLQNAAAGRSPFGASVARFR